MIGRTRIGIKVGDIMTRNFISVKQDTSLIECARKMLKHDVGSLIVTSDNKLAGIMTETDVIRAIVNKCNLEKTKAQDIMTKKVVTIAPSKDIYDALRIMKRTKFRWLPVVIKKHVIGMLTLKDILRIEPSLFDIARETIQIREESEKLKRREEILSGGETWVKEGVCSECGAYGLLYNVGGRMLCESCKDIEE